MILRYVIAGLVSIILCESAFSQVSERSTLYSIYKEALSLGRTGSLDSSQSKIDILLNSDLGCCRDIEALALIQKSFLITRQNKIEKADTLLNKAEAIIRNNQLDSLYSRLYHNRGNLYWIKLDYNSALPWHRKAYYQAKKTNYLKGQRSGLIALIADFINTYQADSANVYAQKLLNLSKESKDSVRMVTALRALGTTSQITRDYIEAGNYLSEALYLAKKINSQSEIPRGYYNLSTLYSALGNYPKAIEYCDYFISNSYETQSYQFLGYQLMFKAYALAKLNKLDEARQILGQAKQDSNLRFRAQDSIYFDAVEGILAFKNGDVTNAEVRLNKVFEGLKKTSNFLHAELIIEALVNLMEHKIDKGKFKEAKEIGLQEIGREQNTYEHKMAFAKLLGEAYGLTSNYKSANRYLQIERLYRDSVNMLYADGLTLSREQFLKQVELDNKLVRLELEKELNDYKVYQRQLWIISACIIGSLLLILLVIWGRHRKIKLESTLTEVKQSLLKLQINPHFIFNVLNSIQNSVLTLKKEKSVELISKFSALTRSVLQNSDKAMVSIQEEIILLTNYMDLEKVRTKNKFDYEIEIGEHIDTHNEEIPSMILQLFIENSIWHGILPKEEKGLIRISFNKESHNIKVTVEDNGIGRKMSANFKTNSQKQKKSMGMDLVRRRINALNKKYKKDIRMKVTDGPNGLGTLVYLMA